MQPGRQRFRYFFASLDDGTIRVFSLEPENLFDQVFIRDLPSKAICNICLLQSSHKFTLLAGSPKGLLHITEVDSVTGRIHNFRQKVLGINQITFAKVETQDHQQVVVNGSKPFLCHEIKGKLCVMPLSFQLLEQICSFNTDISTDGFVGLSRNKELKIFKYDAIKNDRFTQRVLTTKYSPKTLAVNPLNKNLIVLERDYNCLSETQRNIQRKQVSEEHKSSDYLELEQSKVGYPVAASEKKWASCLRIVDPLMMETEYLHEFEDNRTALSLYVSSDKVGLLKQHYMFVGVGVNDGMNIECQQAVIYTYVFPATNPNVPQLIHKTPCEFIPKCFSEL